MFSQWKKKELDLFELEGGKGEGKSGRKLPYLIKRRAKKRGDGPR